MVVVGGWDACGNRFYSKSELYQMAWTDVNLDNLRSFLLARQQLAAWSMFAHCTTQPLPASSQDDTMLALATFDLIKLFVCIYTCIGHASFVLHNLLEQADTVLCRVACARYGGPIATIRDDRKMVLVSGGITQPLVKIYNSAGTQLAVFIWDKGRIEAMGWTSAEDLMIVEQTGEVSACL